MLVTVVALLGGLGVLPSEAPAAASAPGSTVRAAATWVGATPSADPSADPTAAPGPGDATRAPAEPTPVPASKRTRKAEVAETLSPLAAAALPRDTGTGRRVVFDLSAQRVWLVGAGGEVANSYLVSGSLTENLRPGTYAVYSRSRNAVGIDDSGEMEYFVRFTRGANAAIGFHSIPTKDGRALQTRAQLGTPQSHGCVRQALPDAKQLWAFAPVGTKVVVTA